MSLLFILIPLKLEYLDKHKILIIELFYLFCYTHITKAKGALDVKDIRIDLTGDFYYH